MRVCLIHNLYGRTARGGAERVVEIIAKELVRQGHSAFVISAAGSWRENMRAFLRGGWSMEWEGNVRVYRVATANLAPYSRLASVPTSLRLLWHLFDCFAFETRRSVRRILKQERADVVMTHNLMGLGFLLPRLIRRLGIRHIHTLHDVQLLTPSGLMMIGGKLRFPIVWALLLYEKLMCWLVGSPDVVVSPSQWLLGEHVQRGFFEKSRRVVLQNPVIVTNNKSHANVRMMKTNEFRFLYVGQLEKHKGVDVLLQAFRGADIEGVMLDIIGAGSKEKILKKYAQDLPSVVFHGFQHGEALDTFYTTADVVVIPSLVYENTPTVITEAYSHGVPVIASRVGGIPEMVVEADNADEADNAERQLTGWLVPPNDVGALRDALIRVWEQRGTLSKMGDAIREKIHERDVSTYVQHLLGL